MTVDVAELVKALRFYADEGAYDPWGHEDWPGDVVADRGDVARSALKAAGILPEDSP